MKIFSKVLTLNKIHIIENIICTKGVGSKAADYFNIGLPIENPPLLRGSIVINMNISFLTDNKHSFKMGSPVDTGSIKFGFLNPGIDNDIFLKMISCDYDKFYALMLELLNLPSTIFQNISKHRACHFSKPILEKYFPMTVVDFMFNEKNPHAWLFEFCLNTGYTLTEKHIDNIFIPNTYISNPTIKKLQFKLKNKIFTYNPKYGMEGRFL